MIKHISFYKEGQRLIVAPGSNGLFIVKLPSVTSSGYPSRKKLELTAAELVAHEDFKDCDPTLTLEDGRKLRVYNAGNSFIPLVYPSLIIEDFDNLHRRKKVQKSNSVKEKLKKSKAKSTREQHTTQPMAPLIPPPPPKGAKSIIPAPVGTTAPSDPYSVIADDWFGDDDDEDLNNGLYDSSYCPSDDDYGD